jgi:hypothetical protein
MRVLVGIPVIYCEECVEQCLDSLKGQDAGILIIDNNATPKIKKLVSSYPNIINKENIYVNPAWNQIMKMFLNSNYDRLVILNSDMILESDVIEKIKNIDLDGDLTIPLPNVSEHQISEGIREIDWGFPGIMIVLSRKMCELVYPIPESLKIWFGDDWIYRRLKNNGYNLRVFYSIKARHSGSRSIASVKEASEIIEQDKINWLTEEKNI